MPPPPQAVKASAVNKTAVNFFNVRFKFFPKNKSGLQRRKKNPMFSMALKVAYLPDALPPPDYFAGEP